MSKKIKDLTQKREELERELARVDQEMEQEAALARLWVSADEAKRLLALLTDPWAQAELDKYEKVTRTLVELRPEPTGSAGFGDALFTWRSEENSDWEVKLDKRDGEVILTYHGESMSFDFTPEDAGELGRWLLGAAEIGQKIEDES